MTCIFLVLIIPIIFFAEVAKIKADKETELKFQLKDMDKTCGEYGFNICTYSEYLEP